MALDSSQGYRVGTCVEAAYRLFKPGVLTPATTATSLPSGWRVLSELTAIDHLARKSDPEFFGLALQSDVEPEVLFAIRGTNIFLEWLVDAEFMRCTFSGAPSGGNVEDGFCSVYTSLRCATNDRPGLTDRATDARDPSNRRRSYLGAAVATLLAADAAVRAPHLPLNLFTYASPRVGDTTFAAFCSTRVGSHYRIVNRPDIVPHLPPAYEHTGTEFE